MSCTAEYNARLDAWARRESVARYLAAELGQPIRSRHPRARISDEIGSLRGDVLGIGRHTFRVKHDKLARISKSLDAAEALAVEREDGSLGMLALRRPGRSTGEAYAVSTLDAFATLCASLSPEGMP
jgi:hypothetical protein